MWPLFVLSTALIFSPNWIAARVGYNEFLEEYRKWIGFLFLVTFSFILVDMVKRLYIKFNRYNRDRKIKKFVKGHLVTLSPEQKKIISYLIDPTKPSGITLSPANGDVQDLVRKRIIIRTGSLGNYSGFPHSLTEIASSVLAENWSLTESIKSYEQSNRI